MPEEWEEQKGSDFVKLEVGNTIEGKLVAIREGQYGDIYDMELEDGKIVTVGTATVLHSRITESHIGKKIKIERLPNEKGKNGKFEYKNYKIFIKVNK